MNAQIELIDTSFAMYVPAPPRIDRSHAVSPELHILNLGLLALLARPATRACIAQPWQCNATASDSTTIPYHSLFS